MARGSPMLTLMLASPMLDFFPSPALPTRLVNCSFGSSLRQIQKLLKRLPSGSTAGPAVVLLAVYSLRMGIVIHQRKSEQSLKHPRPFTWESGTLDPVQNPYTWVNLTVSALRLTIHGLY